MAREPAGHRQQADGNNLMESQNTVFISSILGCFGGGDKPGMQRLAEPLHSMPACCGFHSRASALKRLQAITPPRRADGQIPPCSGMPTAPKFLFFTNRTRQILKYETTFCHEQERTVCYQA
jgi:hypothetical protein